MYWSEFQIPCQWNLGSGLQWLAEFRIPMPMIPNFTGKRFRDFGIRIIFDWPNHRETNDKQILSNRKQRKPLILNVFHDLSL